MQLVALLKWHHHLSSLLLIINPCFRKRLNGGYKICPEIKNDDLCRNYALWRVWLGLRFLLGKLENS